MKEFIQINRDCSYNNMPKSCDIMISNQKTISEIVNNKRYCTKIDSYNLKYSSDNKCVCKDSNLISLYAKLENNIISEVSYNCLNCDILLKAVLEIFCEKIQGNKIKFALNIHPYEIEEEQIFSKLDSKKRKYVKKYIQLVRNHFKEMVQNQSINNS
jgi:hypothetical protein